MGMGTRHVQDTTPILRAVFRGQLLPPRVSGGEREKPYAGQTSRRRACRRNSTLRRCLAPNGRTAKTKICDRRRAIRGNARAIRPDGHGCDDRPNPSPQPRKPRSQPRMGRASYCATDRLRRKTSGGELRGCRSGLSRVARYREPEVWNSSSSCASTSLRDDFAVKALVGVVRLVDVPIPLHRFRRGPAEAICKCPIAQ